AIALPIIGIKIADRLEIVKQRPDNFIGKPVIKIMNFLFVQANRLYFIAKIQLGLPEDRINPIIVSGNSRPAYPYPALLSQNRNKSCYESAGALFNRPLPVTFF